MIGCDSPTTWADVVIGLIAIGPLLIIAIAVGWMMVKS